MRKRAVLAAALALLLLISVGMVARDLLAAAGEKRANAALSAQVHAPQAEDAVPQTVPRDAVRLPSSRSEADIEHPSQSDQETRSPARKDEAIPSEADETVTMLPQYAWLWELNSDFAGWLSIDGTEIDYPVVYTPEDQDSYLRRAFDGSDARSGTLFIAVPWQAGHTLIYGHNMKNDTMLGTLLRYEDAAFAADHPTVRFDTLVETGEYEVVAAFRSKAAKRSSEGVFPYWMYTDLTDEADFETYVAAVKGLSLYDTGIEPVYGDELLTISTCDYYTTQGRFVVVARRRKAGQ